MYVHVRNAVNNWKLKEFEMAVQHKSKVYVCKELKKYIKFGE